MDFSELISRNREKILQSIDPRGNLLIHLLSEGLIDYDDRDRIKRRGERRAMAELTLDIVTDKWTRDETVGSRFVSCLLSSGQKHIAALLNEYKQDVSAVAPHDLPMSNCHRRLLQTKLVQLVQCIDPKGDLICHLTSLGVLSDRDVEKIRDQKSMDEMSEVLLVDILPFKPDSAFGGFVEALKRSNQVHVANILEPNNACVERPMSPEHRQFLTQNLSHLSRNMEPRYGLVTALVSRGVISELDTERIETHSTTDVMNESIIRILSRKPESAFSKFLSALKDTGQSHVLTNCYGHNINLTLDLNIPDASERSKIEDAIVEELRDKLIQVEGNIVEGIRRECILITLRCPSVECLRLLWTRKQENELAENLHHTIEEILRSRGMTLTFPIDVEIDQNDYNRCLLLFSEAEMSTEHRNYLTRQQFNSDLLVSNDLLVRLYSSGILRSSELLQISNQLRLDDRRDRLLDALKRKPDSLFGGITKAFSDAKDRPRGSPGHGRDKDDDFYRCTFNALSPDTGIDYPIKKARNIMLQKDGKCISIVNVLNVLNNKLLLQY